MFQYYWLLACVSVLFVQRRQSLALHSVNNGLEKDREWSGRGLFELIFEHIPGRTEDNNEKKMSGKTFRDSNWVLSKYRYSSTVCLNSALNWERGEGSTPWSGHFIPGKEARYSSYRRVGRHQGRCGRVRKISLPTVVRPSGSNNPTRSKSLYRLSYTFRPSRPVLG